MPDSEPAQKIPVAAAASAGLYLRLQGAGTGVFAGVPAGFLHAQLRLAAQLLPLFALHLGLRAVRVGRPEAVVVAGELPQPPGQRFLVALPQYAVNRPGGQQAALALQLLVGLLPQPTHRAGGGRGVQAVQRVFYGDVAGQPPQGAVAAAPQPQVAEDAVQHAVQVSPGQVAPVFAVGGQHPGGRIAQAGTVGGKGRAGGTGGQRGRGQGTQGGVQVALVEIQLAPQLIHNAPCHRGFPLGLGLDVLSHGALLSAIRNVIFANILQIVKIVRFFRGTFGAA